MYSSIIYTFRLAMKLLKKAAAISDVHLGKSSNSIFHNENCYNFVKWTAEQIKADPTIDHIVVGGDWHEHRSSVHGITLKYSVDAMKILNSLNMPVFWLLGNHDLVQRQTRNYYTTYFANCFDNFRVIEEPTIVPEIYGSALMCPFLFEHEYKDLVQYTNIPVWWGHFEFKGFVITGHNVKMEHGPDHTDFVGPKRIFSGHFHKRQSVGAVYYIGNVFPTNYGDVGDTARGLTIYDYETDEVTHAAWPDAPVFAKVRLTALLDGTIDLPMKASVRCIIDMPITYEESIALKQNMIAEYELREFIMEETDELALALSENDATLSSIAMGTTELVMDMLQHIDTPKIDRSKLISIYNSLKKN